MDLKPIFFKLFLYRPWKNNQQKTTKGFTLTELLTTVILSGIVLSALLGAMVKILKSDQIEADRTRVQQEMQLAIDYIAHDLKEAVYVYNATQINDLIDTKSIPDFGTDVTPILAFWKTESISENDLPSSNYCNNLSDNNKQIECNNLRVKRHAYSLIVYLQSKQEDDTWKGKSRILRYRLPKYSSPNTLDYTQGFIDPGVYENFSTWPLHEGNDLQLNNKPTKESSSGNYPVLVDFVDDPTNIVENQLVCPDLDGDSNTTEYARVPDNQTNFNSFYSCVRITGALGTKQDVIVYLRGNTKERGEQSYDNDVKAQLQTRVTTGGVIDKFGAEN